MSDPGAYTYLKYNPKTEEVIQPVSNLGGVSQAYVDNGDATTLASAQSYADTQDATTLASAQSYADTGDATTLSSAQTYTDNAISGLNVPTPGTLNYIHIGTNHTLDTEDILDQTRVLVTGDGAGNDYNANDEDNWCELGLDTLQNGISVGGADSVTPTQNNTDSGNSTNATYGIIDSTGSITFNSTTGRASLPIGRYMMQVSVTGRRMSGTGVRGHFIGLGIGGVEPATGDHCAQQIGGSDYWDLSCVFTYNAVSATDVSLWYNQIQEGGGTSANDVNLAVKWVIYDMSSPISTI